MRSLCAAEDETLPDTEIIGKGKPRRRFYPGAGFSLLRSVLFYIVIFNFRYHRAEALFCQADER